MHLIRSASFEEYVRWYLARERRKLGMPEDAAGRAWHSVLSEMRRVHPDKLRPWFEDAQWLIVSLDAFAEAESLVCVDSPETRRIGLVAESGPDNRLMRTVVAEANETGYFQDLEVCRSNSIELHFRQERIESYRRNWPGLREGERLSICTMNDDEQAANPGGSYYLHDGFGRLLPYLYLIMYESASWRPVEAFLAEEPWP